MTRTALSFVTRTLCADGSASQPAPVLDDAAWTQILSFANQHLLTPALHGSLNRQGQLDTLPREVAGYLAHLADANSQRNHMMYRQGIELSAQLNTVGIVPMFLKSAGDLMEGAAVLGSDGIVGDLDVLVPADAGARAVEVLAGVGYRPWGVLEPNDHTYADLGRKQDAALIDLHTNVLDLGHLLPAAEMHTDAALMTRDGARFMVPSPENRLLHRLVHDLIQGRGLYTGRLHLGHAWRTAWMLRHHQQQVNWGEIYRRARGHRLTTALGVELLGVNLFGLAAAPVPTRLAARALHAWRVLRLTHPQLSVPGNAFGGVIDLYTRMRFFTRQAG